MAAKFLSLLFAVVAVAACGATPTDETTAAGQADGAVATGIVEDATADASADVDEAAEPNDDDEAETGDDGETGSADDRSLLDESSGPVGELLFADTIAGPDAPSSARFEGRVSIVGTAGSDLPGSYDITIAGAYDIAARSSDLTIDMGGLLDAAAAAEGTQMPAEMRELLGEPMQIITVDEMGWLKWPFFAMFTGSTESAGLWIEMDADEVGGTTESFGFAGVGDNPTELLEQFAGAEGSVEDVGVETVNGVEARHWRAWLDLEALAEASDPEERAELESQFGDLVGSEFPLDVWIGVNDGYIYRYALDLSGESLLGQGSGGGVASVTLAFDFFDYNADQGISPPPADQIISGDELSAVPFGVGGSLDE